LVKDSLEVVLFFGILKDSKDLYKVTKHTLLRIGRVSVAIHRLVRLNWYGPAEETQLDRD